MRLRGTKESIIKRINELEVSNWIDGGTRAVFIEFSVYNAQVKDNSLRDGIVRSSNLASHTYAVRFTVSSQVKFAYFILSTGEPIRCSNNCGRISSGRRNYTQLPNRWHSADALPSRIWPICAPLRSFLYRLYHILHCA